MTVRIDLDGPVTIVTIDRPAKRNAVDPLTALALREAFTAFAKDDRARVAILTGSSGQFCAGFDLGAVGTSRYDPDGPGPMGPTRMLLEKPVIAAVEGHAVAGGLELALWCDMRVAAEGAIFGVYCRRWGVPLIDGGTVRLPRIVGQGRALDMILTGRPVAADEALRIGLADRIVPDGEALVAAIDLAKQVAAFPQICMNSDRLSAYRQWDFDIEAALAHEARAGVAPLREGAAAGAKKFTEGAGRGGSFDAFKGK
ncbi:MULTISPECIES: crotonase/enoyl-CoA hydratase family protein [unclassified Sphingopyxis]|uniref:crotonase/enoyl-CoA hydratase family protein n=1 Tax=unclassified Sphingopyxis TaxID=2614943 RepID=UPI00072FBDD6|nr:MULTISPECIES: crotonase/enoyl-CoA hydratase family protein [unclassified Sphingopyxis]KTE24413.1 enoyl-CoA hydratase [Sphingopyxis sp. H057]KTE50941.1 enoyl-CoA hydratase [Sphingopyxis sp. H071]KTE52084.1 enoyl-CoA hydratase [Sphingopyxis sp. H073]KTE60583.1 enoyl-CoA hydratase [Sphingopyxis sp. H107]KTE63829.1 enoyl-CoA hydratase [Sphingopyxis sp. H100]